MPKPFLERLHKYFASVNKVLEAKAEASSIFANSGDIGTSRESVYMEFLQQHLPPACNIQKGGFLFGQTGDESKQLDIIITSNHCPQYRFLESNEHKSFACVDGAVAAVTVKSTLDKKQLFDALGNLASIPALRPDADALLFALPMQYHFGDSDEFPFKIVYASDGLSLETTRAHLDQFYADHPEIPVTRRPNLIHVAGKFHLARAGKQGAEDLRSGRRFEPHCYVGPPESDGVYPLCYAVAEIHRFGSAIQRMQLQYENLYNAIPYISSSKEPLTL